MISKDFKFTSQNSSRLRDLNIVANQVLSAFFSRRFYVGSGVKQAKSNFSQKIIILWLLFGRIYSSRDYLGLL